ncbi:unnamed protein product, partial [Sphenostylis stenocarpa]
MEEVTHCKQDIESEEDNEGRCQLKSLQEAAYNIWNIAIDEDAYWIGVFSSLPDCYSWHASTDNTAFKDKYISSILNLSARCKNKAKEGRPFISPAEGAQNFVHDFRKVNYCHVNENEYGNKYLAHAN